MGDEVEARAQCVCDHLHRPDHPDRKLTDAKVRSTGNQTVPRFSLSMSVPYENHRPARNRPSLQVLKVLTGQRLGDQLASGGTP
jgi:hypothetical protein